MVRAPCSHQPRLGIWYSGRVSVHETMPACSGSRTSSIPSGRHTPSARRGPSSRRGIYFIRSARSNLSRTFFSRKMKCRITGRPRYPDHQQPSHKRGRTTARSATGTSVAPGPPVTHVAPLPHPIDPEVRRACMKVRGGYRTEARRPPYPPPGPMHHANLRARGAGSAYAGRPGGHGGARAGRAYVRVYLPDGCS